MGLRITIDLDDDDLKHFRLIMQAAQKSARRCVPEEIVARAEAQLAELRDTALPGFVRERLTKLQSMIAMLSDDEWRLPQRDATRVLNALAYFTEPEDLIPDHIPAIGLLDDAIMIELVIRELRHELDAYADFCDFRRSCPPRKGVKRHTGAPAREIWLETRRKALQDRMHRRRRSGKGPRNLLT
jgi:uncharacterized membrane protein YkvA (DUF1232 family)